MAVEAKSATGEESRSSTDVAVMPQSKETWNLKQAVINISRRPGIFVAFISTFLFALQAICIKLLSGYVSPIEIVALRYFVMGTCCLIMNIYKHIQLRPASIPELKFFLFRPFVGLTTIICQFYAYQNMRVADATAIFYANPAATCILACIFLKEALHCLDLLLVFLAIAGVTIVARPQFLFRSENDEVTASGSPLAVCAAIVGCVFLAGSNVYVRSGNHLRIHPYKITFYHAYLNCAIAVVIVTVLSHWTVPCLVDKLILSCIGLLSFFSECTYVYALTVESSILVSTILTNEVVFIFILQTTILNVSIDWLSVIGAVTIVSSSLLISQKSLAPLQCYDKCPYLRKPQVTDV